MTLVGGRDLLAAAERGGYAIPGCNVSNIELALGVVDAAEARRAPLLLQLNPANLDHFGGLTVAGASIRALAERSEVPIAVHLDHGSSVAMLRAAVQVGFTSLMFDGSTLSLDRNIRETRDAYAVAIGANVALEAELGHVSGREPGVLISEAALTDPEAARRFVEETKVDSLAVSVGTAHGLAGEVDLDLVVRLREATHGLPLVLHGGSGVRPGQLREAVTVGIRKVNLSTELHTAFARGIKEMSGDDPRPALMNARAAVADTAASRIDQLGAALQA